MLSRHSLLPHSPPPLSPPPLPPLSPHPLTITRNSCQCLRQEKWCLSKTSDFFSSFSLSLLFLSSLSQPPSVPSASPPLSTSFSPLLCLYLKRVAHYIQAENSGDGRFPVCQACTCEGPRLPLSSCLTDTLIVAKSTHRPDSTARIRLSGNKFSDWNAGSWRWDCFFVCLRILLWCPTLLLSLVRM